MSACGILGLGPENGTGTNGPTQNGERDPTAQELAPGLPIVDTLASTLELDKAQATADGVDAITLTATLVTPSGDPAAGAMLELFATGSANTFLDAVVIADDDGIATATMVSTRAEEKTLTARVSDALLSEQNVTFVAGAPDATRSRFVAVPAHPRANGTDSTAVTLYVRDAFDNAVPALDTSITLTGAAIAPPGPLAGTTDAAGRHTFSLTSTVVETKSLVATVDGVTIAGSVRFVDEWFNASGAPFGVGYRCVVVDPQIGPGRVDVVTENGAYFSRDAGKTFGEASAGLPSGVECRALLLDRSGAVPVLVAALKNGSVFSKAHDAATWQPVGGDHAGEILSAWLDTRDATPAIYIARDTAPIVMRYSAPNWVDETASLTGTRANAFAQSGATLYVATNTDVFSRTSGAWTPTAFNAEARVIAAVDDTVVAGGDNGTAHKVGSAGWVSENEVWPADVCTAPCTTRVVALAIDAGASPATLYAATTEAVALPGPPPQTLRSRVFARAITGDLFIPLSQQAEVTYEPISSLTVSARTLFIGLERRGVFKAGSVATTRLGNGLRAYPVRDLAVDLARTPPRVFLCDAASLYFSDDEGDHWTDAAVGETFAIDVAGDRLRIATTAGLFDSTDGGATFASLNEELDDIVAIAGDYVSDGAALYQRHDDMFDELSFTGDIAALTLVPEGLVVATDTGAYLAAQQVFAGNVARVARTPLGAFVFATTAGIHRAGSISGLAMLLDSGGATPARSFVDVLIDDRSAAVWGGTTASSSDPVVFIFDAAGVATPVAAGLPVGVSVKRMALIAQPLVTKRTVFVGFDGSTGVHASTY